MHKRTAHVNQAELNSISYSSIFEVGDSYAFEPKTYAIAVQKSGRPHQSDEGFDFHQFSLFQKEIDTSKMVSEPSRLSVYQHRPSIHVNRVNIIGVSSSSLVQFGVLHHADCASRIKHIRVLSPQQSVMD
ncbi:spore germination protein GerPE [Radiobacillus kanasensis]|uniref:spore germination protein GerPE n=1 Tax=Radiobacillus kanasensis TaxID=2844358 RepID=UPI001E5CBCEE|nr:spore germination protein GerPE [Radiobacillus kanasensis]UFU00525.1 spore germination protein GerPE [Radiobacillus kanasensis]